MAKTIRKGDRGDDVKRLQRLLSEHGYACGADGVFGSGTEAKVMAFQRDRGLGADGIVGTGTWAALEAPIDDEVEKQPPFPLPPVLVHLQSLGHKIMCDGDFHLNLFGIRNPNAKSNSFDDILGCAYTEKGLWKVHFWPGTCDPGTYHLENPGRVEGTAILVEGQYSAWKIDLHGGKYEALCQRAAEVRVYRDADKDANLDMDPDSIMEGYFGINLHRSSKSGESAGCQVHARLDGFNEMMALAHKQVDVLGEDVFTYTLMKQWW
jgi:peptidoglycan hydrolase-like protein with peptidoglycan-binding domain